ncbi:transposase [Rhizobium sp. Nf11,1]|uniref:transposase n=1 Tax=Rhizobium sp. Nf11,1 TaxID=3404923 RepID=UPI003D343288
MSLTDAMMEQFGAAALAKPMSKAEVYALLDALKSVLLEHQARLTALESHGVKYAGVYQKALGYRRGTVCTHAGSMWIALADTPEGVAPGSNGAFWQLAEKGRPTRRVKAKEREQ